MGTNTNQIATRTNIQTGKRKYAYFNADTLNMQKCPTKGEINQIEFLDVKNSITSTIINESCGYNSQTDDNWNNCMGIGANGVSVGVRDEPGSKYCNANYGLICYMKDKISHNSISSLLRIGFTSDRSDLINYKNDKNFITKASLFYHNITVTPNKPTKLDFTLACLGYAHTTPPMSSFPTSTGQNYICDVDDTVVGQNCIFSIVILDGNDECIFISDYTFENASSFLLRNMTFTANIISATSSVTAYIIPSNMYICFYPKISGDLYVAAGFKSTIDVTSYDSYYDNDYKLAQYEDIGTDTARRFGVYYGVWNNKETPARVDFAEALIHTSSDPLTSGWTSIGKVTLSDIAGYGTRSGVITCTLPTNIDLGTTQYYLIIRVGDTLNDQDFYGGWGNSQGDPAWYYCQKNKRGWTPSVPLTPELTGGHSVLNKLQISSTETLIVKGIYNTNPEIKGWIRIE